MLAYPNTLLSLSITPADASAPITAPPNMWAVEGIPVRVSVKMATDFERVIRACRSAISSASGINADGFAPLDKRVPTPNQPFLNFNLLSKCCIKRSTLDCFAKSLTNTTLIQPMGSDSGFVTSLSIRRKKFFSATFGIINNLQKPDPAPYLTGSK